MVNNFRPQTVNIYTDIEFFYVDNLGVTLP